jgi:hypothetical protein
MDATKEASTVAPTKPQTVFVLSDGPPDLVAENVATALAAILTSIRILLFLGLGVLIWCGAVVAGFIKGNRRGRKSW